MNSRTVTSGEQLAFTPPTGRSCDGCRYGIRRPLPGRGDRAGLLDL